MTDAMLKAISVLLDAIMRDEAKSGGLLTRDTIRKADELRVLLLVEKVK